MSGSWVSALCHARDTFAMINEVLSTSLCMQIWAIPAALHIFRGLDQHLIYAHREQMTTLFGFKCHAWLQADGRKVASQRKPAAWHGVKAARTARCTISSHPCKAGQATQQGHADL